MLLLCSLLLSDVVIVDLTAYTAPEVVNAEQYGKYRVLYLGIIAVVCVRVYMCVYILDQYRSLYCMHIRVRWYLLTVCLSSAFYLLIGRQLMTSATYLLHNLLILIIFADAYWFLVVRTDNKVDLWAVGVITYALLGGYLPFGDDENTPLLMKKISRVEYEFHNEYWSHVSDRAKVCTYLYVTVYVFVRISMDVVGIVVYCLINECHSDAVEIHDNNDYHRNTGLDQTTLSEKSEAKAQCSRCMSAPLGTYSVQYVST
jgi:serine/threonine protein kinase